MDRKQPQGGNRMVTEKEQQLEIENGPCEMDFFVLGLARRQPVEFTIRGVSQIIKVIINSIEAEDGSGKSWCFKGYLQQNSKIGSAGNSFNAWFDYRHNRKGWIKISG
jgi:hypothetical protein